MKKFLEKVTNVADKANPMNLISKAGEAAGEMVVK
jgi:hypothetical protein